VLRIERGAIVEITTFGAALFPKFGLPVVLTQSDQSGPGQEASAAAAAGSMRRVPSE
jgi:hypothetical protein